MPFSGTGPRQRGAHFVPPIADVVRLLKASPERLDKQVRKRFREIAQEVRDDARQRAQAAHPPPGPRHGRRGSGHWRQLVNSIRSGATSTSPHVAIGSESVPWALGWEFGSLGNRTVRSGKRKLSSGFRKSKFTTTHRGQFPPWRGSDEDAGYFFYPAVRAAMDKVQADMVKAIDEAMSEAFPD